MWHLKIRGMFNFSKVGSSRLSTYISVTSSLIEFNSFCDFGDAYLFNIDLILSVMLGLFKMIFTEMAADDRRPLCSTSSLSFFTLIWWHVCCMQLQGVSVLAWTVKAFIPVAFVISRWLCLPAVTAFLHEFYLNKSPYKCPNLVLTEVGKFRLRAFCKKMWIFL